MKSFCVARCDRRMLWTSLYAHLPNIFCEVLPGLQDKTEWPGMASNISFNEETISAHGLKHELHALQRDLALLTHQVCILNIHADNAGYLEKGLRCWCPVGFSTGPRSGGAAGLGSLGLQPGTLAPRPHSCNAHCKLSATRSPVYSPRETRFALHD